LQNGDDHRPHEVEEMMLRLWAEYIAEILTRSNNKTRQTEHWQSAGAIPLAPATKSEQLLPRLG